MLIPGQITTLTDNRTIGITALVDSGAALGSYIDEEFVERNNIPKRRAAIPISVYNADGTINKNGSIHAFVDLRLQIGDHSEIMELAITRIKSREIFLGYDWLQKHNPSVDWVKNTIEFDRCPAKCGYIQAILGPDDEEEDKLENGDRLFMVDLDDEKERQIRAIT